MRRIGQTDKDSRTRIWPRVVCLDTETTGVKPFVDRIVQIGCVELLEATTIGHSRCWLLDPECPIPEEASKVHGITDDMVRGMPKFPDVVDDILTMLGGDPLVIHNAKFDIGMLNAELARLGRPAICNPVVDTLPMLRARVKGREASLEAGCRMFGISLARRRERHDALIDAELLAELYGHLIGAKRRTLFDIPRHAPAGAGTLAEGGAARSTPWRDAPRGPVADRGLGRPSPAERAAHQGWRARLGLPALCALMVALTGCASVETGQPPQTPAASEPRRITILDEAKPLTAEDRILTGRPRSASPDAPSNRPAQPEPAVAMPATGGTGGGTSPLPTSRDIVDARTLAILSALLGSHPPPAPPIGQGLNGSIQTGVSPALRLIQP